VKLARHTDPDARKLFMREIKIMRLLPRNPHVVAYLGHGVTASGRPYLVMEYVDGITLAELIQRGVTMTERQACRIVLQLCEALTALHALGGAHRDIQPKNVLISRGGGTVKLFDFGLVRDDHGLVEYMEGDGQVDGREFSSPLSDDLLVGTPNYLAIEQILEAVDPQSQARSGTATDVHGLALLMYVMLSGRRPWPFRVRAGANTEHALRAYFKWRLTCDPRALVRPEGCSPALWSIVQLALQSNPRRRPADAPAFGDHIRRYLRTGLPCEPSPADTIQAPMRFVVRRTRTWPRLGAVLAAAMMIL